MRKGYLPRRSLETSTISKLANKGIEGYTFGSDNLNPICLPLFLDQQKVLEKILVFCLGWFAIERKVCPDGPVSLYRWWGILEKFDAQYPTPTGSRSPPEILKIRTYGEI